MKNEKGGFYEKEGVPQEEIERLKTFEYPTYVSESLLKEEYLAGKRFLDVGAGANTHLAKFIQKENGIYVPLDLRMEMLKSLKDGVATESMAFSGINADVRKLPFADHNIDFIHQRFVLMHLSPDDRKQAVQEILRVTKEKAFLLEYDWGTMRSSHHQNQLGEFLTAMETLSKKLGIEQLMGAKLEGLLQETNPRLRYDIEHFDREEQDYTSDLIGLSNMGSKMASVRLNDKSLSDKFTSLEKTLKEEPIVFVPAEIVAAKIEV